MTVYIWQQEEWPHFTWDTGVLLSPLGECRLRQGKLLSKLETLGLNLDPQAQAAILVEEPRTPPPSKTSNWMSARCAPP